MWQVVSFVNILCVCVYLILLEFTALLLVWESWHKGSNAPFIRCPVADKERMKPDQWLESVLCVFSSVSTLLVSWQEGHMAHNSLCHLCPNVLFWSKWSKQIKGVAS